MNSDPTSSSQPSQPAPESRSSSADPGQSLPEQYLTEELHKARSRLRRSRIVSVLLILAVLAYMSFLTIALKKYFEPMIAAEMANSFIAEQAHLRASELGEQLKKDVPAFIRGLPDLILEQAPLYRAALEGKIEADFVEYCRSTSRQLSTHVDEFLVEHKDKLKPLLAASQDREAFKQFGADLETEIMDYLKEKPEGGESIKEKLDQSLQALEKVDEHLKRLAMAKDLSYEEKQKRRAIAILVQTTNRDMNRGEVKKRNRPGP
jgi:hypothetical protein